MSGLDRINRMLQEGQDNPENILLILSKNNLKKGRLLD